MITDELSPNLIDVDSLRFVHCLTSRDPNIRNRGFEMITRTIDTWLGGYGSPPGSRMGRVNGGLDCTALVQEQLGDILRLSVQCPFDDVREKCTNLLEDLKVCTWVFFKLIFAKRNYVGDCSSSINSIWLFHYLGGAYGALACKRLDCHTFN